MIDLFETKNIAPMLIKTEVAPFDDPDYIYELKLDGSRCIAYLDPRGKTQFYNKRKMLLNPHFPELLNIHQAVKGRCILDGEIFIMRDGRPNFAEVQKRSLTTDIHKIKLLATKRPATFIAYDILYYRGKSIIDLPLIERKRKLETVVKQESAQFSYCRYIKEHGTQLFELTKEKDLEGIIAKHVNSKYYFDKRTKDWLKIKNMLDNDFVICGCIIKGTYSRKLVLGQYTADKELVYKGNVAGISKQVLDKVLALPKAFPPFKDYEKDDVIWVEPALVCKVKFMEYTANGSMRQPAFVALRDDKLHTDCVEPV